MMNKRHPVMVAVLMSILVAGAASAAPTQGVPQQLTEIQQNITDLQNSVNNIIPPDQSNVRFTPPIFIPSGQFVGCQVVNVTSVNQKVRVDMLNGDGGVVVSQTHDPLPPGAVKRLPAVSPGLGLVNAFWCRFIVVDASRAAIRASIDGTIEFAHHLSYPAE